MVRSNSNVSLEPASNEPDLKAWRNREKDMQIRETLTEIINRY